MTAAQSGRRGRAGQRRRAARRVTRCAAVCTASRPPRAIGNFFKGDVHAFSPQTLAFMVETLYREIRALRIYEGASDVQRIVIARAVLGG